jgi:arginase
MRLRLVTVPYDSALRDERMGRGPLHLLRQGLVDVLRDAGHDIDAHGIEAIQAPPLEVRTSFELSAALAGQVRDAVSGTAGPARFPLVLAGNCNTSVGTVAGLGPAEVGVVWFDCHADFNTPETTLSGFLDGMALAILVGRCWRQAAARVPGFRPVREENVLLVGARDLDPLEAELLAGSAVQTVTVSAVRTNGLPQALRPGLRAIRERVQQLYVHLDLDVLDPAEARANGLGAPGGLTVAEVSEALRLIAAECRIGAVALTAYDPSFDASGATSRAAFRLIEAVLASNPQSSPPSQPFSS